MKSGNHPGTVDSGKPPRRAKSCKSNALAPQEPETWVDYGKCFRPHQIVNSYLDQMCVLRGESRAHIVAVFAETRRHDLGSCGRGCAHSDEQRLGTRHDPPCGRPALVHVEDFEIVDALMPEIALARFHGSPLPELAIDANANQ